MARFARVIAVDVAHHVTQRGNGRRYILDADSEREVYLGLLRENIGRDSAQDRPCLLGYCLMSNHVHLVMMPHRADALAKALKNAHGRYAAYWNATHGSSGHVWQGRFYSCPLDPTHLWEALRYTELNPVRAGLVARAEAWTWSSAAVHCGASAAESWLAMDLWKDRWDASSWDEFLAAGQSEDELTAVRQCTHTGRPLGGKEFVSELERSMQRPLAARRGGRPARQARDEPQAELAFGP
jgi:putative transposase